MKNLLYTYSITIMMCVTTVSGSVAQTYNDNDGETTGNEVVLEGTQVNQAALANLGIFTSVNPRSATLTGRSVFLTQIGDLNQVSVDVTAEASEINIVQNGNENFTGLQYVANTAIANLVQNGNQNVIVDFANVPETDISLDLTQNGDGLNFQRQGVNELTKSLRFTQTEGTPSLIIRSFN